MSKVTYEEVVKSLEIIGNLSFYDEDEERMIIKDYWDSEYNLIKAFINQHMTLRIIRKENKMRAKMSKADKMFEELGYIKSTTDWVDEIVYLHRLQKTNLQIVFDTHNREYHSEQNNNLVTITVKEHLAIHEKLTELRWIE